MYEDVDDELWLRSVSIHNFASELNGELGVPQSQRLAAVMGLRWYHAMPTLATEPSMAMSWRVADASQDMVRRCDIVGRKYILLSI
jgi:hypothetical protein